MFLAARKRTQSVEEAPGPFLICGKDAPQKEIAVSTIFRSKDVYKADPTEHSGGWYADPYGLAARRWFDHVNGWSDRVQEAGKAPDKTGVARVDEAAVARDWTREMDEDGKLVPLSRPVDAQYLANARPVR